MRLTIPANYDSSILPILKDLSVSEIYGRLNDDIVGGGRPSYMAAPLRKKALSAYIRAIHTNGMEFNYLMNSACLGNREWTKGFQNQFERELMWLESQAVDTITVATPFLLEIIKKRHPRFKVKVGIYAQVDTVKRAEYWDGLGADAINLASFSINRDFEKLTRIRQAVKADLVLIANHFCQPNCPYQIQHQNNHAHASGKDAKFLIDYPIFQCQHNRLRNPRLFIAAGWIRPEDLKAYETIGYTTFKLLERNIPSEEIVKRATAYHNRQFEGNLADLLLSWGFKKTTPQFSFSHLVRTFRPWKLKLKKARMLMDFMKGQGMMFPRGGEAPITIDSSAIPNNFLDHFQKGSCLDRSCDSCGYCAGIARKAVSIQPSFLDEVLPKYAAMQADMVSGGMWE